MEDAISKMQYLHAALMETLRLYPAIPVPAWGGDQARGRRRGL